MALPKKPKMASAKGKAAVFQGKAPIGGKNPRKGIDTKPPMKELSQLPVDVNAPGNPANVKGGKTKSSRLKRNIGRR
jgi:hypothetical protein